MIKRISTQVSIMYGTSDGGDGGTEGDGGSEPPSIGLPEFGQDEVNDMEDLILSLSKESDDDTRREKLAGIMDKELADGSNNAASGDDPDGTAVGAETPRFAKLFQSALDNVGEKVQADAREKALEQQQQMNLIDSDDMDAQDGGDGSEGGERTKRVKSPEELQLWALIDMMVQSKTLVKSHMGSLGSKGEFR